MIYKSNNGITLVALIITVIVLLILAGTAITIAINGGDIFNKSVYAKNEWINSVEEEEGEHGRINTTIKDGENVLRDLE